MEIETVSEASDINSILTYVIALKRLYSIQFKSQISLMFLKIIYFDVESARSSETSVVFQRTTRHYIPEDRTLHCHRCENVKSY
jgi:hypothetical protein